MKILAKVFAQLEARSHRWISMWLSLQRKMVLSMVSVLWIAFFPISGSAAVITFTPTLLADTQWRVDYAVTAGASDLSIDEFTIFFDPTRFTNLVVDSVPSAWDPVIIQPDTGIPAEGFFDALALVFGISPGTSLGGFSVSFELLGSGTPGIQRFDIVDPNTYATLSTGFTTATIAPPPPTTNVPEPNSLTLAGLALALFLGFSRRSFRKNRK